MVKKTKYEQNMLKKRVQQIMTLNQIDYDTWLNQQHEIYVMENMACIDKIVDQEIKRRTAHSGGNHRED